MLSVVRSCYLRLVCLFELQVTCDEVLARSHLSHQKRPFFFESIVPLDVSRQTSSEIEDRDQYRYSDPSNRLHAVQSSLAPRLRASLAFCLVLL